MEQENTATVKRPDLLDDDTFKIAMIHAVINIGTVVLLDDVDISMTKKATIKQSALDFFGVLSNHFEQALAFKMKEEGYDADDMRNKLKEFIDNLTTKVTNAQNN